MQIDQTADEEGVRFSVKGSLSGTERSTVRLFETVSIAIDKLPSRIVLDLTQTLYVDSMSIGLLVGILLKCKERGIPFRLENVPEHIRSVLDSVKLKKAFPELYE